MLIFANSNVKEKTLILKTNNFRIFNTKLHIFWLWIVLNDDSSMVKLLHGLVYATISLVVASKQQINNYFNKR